MNKVNFSLVSQNKNAIPSHSQPTNISSKSKVNWAKVAKGIALLGGLVVAGYSLYLLKGRLSPTPPSSCFANGKPAIELNGTICCLGDSNCMGSGPGTFRWSDGNSYPGNLVKGVFSGKGSYTLPSGDSYAGDLENGVRHGRGLFQWFDGSSYDGGFEYGAHTGTGTFTFSNGVSSYKGGFVDGVFSGQGTYTWKDRHSYTGTFLQGKFHGKGTLTRLDGSTCDREYKNGVFISEVCDEQSV